MPSAQLFKVHSRFTAAIEPDWRRQLHELLGEKPRRLSRWCELGMYGALRCVKPRQSSFNGDVAIRVHTQLSTFEATLTALAQAQDFPPMPFTFMQSQPGQLFNALGKVLSWQGDATIQSSCLAPPQQIAQLREIPQHTLLGWLDDQPQLVSRWLWLQRQPLDSGPTPFSSPQWRATDSLDCDLVDVAWLHVDAAGALFAL